MPNDWWNGLGALLVVTVLLASHPLRPMAAEELTQRIAINWTELSQEKGCSQSLTICQMAPMSMPMGSSDIR